MYQREMAEAVKTHGSLVYPILKLYNDQLRVPEQITVAVLTYLTNWDTKLQAFLNLVLDSISLILLVKVYGQSRPVAYFGVAVLFSALIFYIYQDVHWLYMNYTHYAQLFIVAAGWVLVCKPIRWLSLLTAAILMFCASFSTITAFTGWGT